MEQLYTHQTVAIEHALARRNVVMEIAGDELYFQTITEKGQPVDYGIIRKDESTNKVIGTSGAGRATPARPVTPTRPATPARPVK